MDICEDNASVLPPLYASWLEQHLGGPIPAEREATCAQCAMLRPEASAVRRGQTYFRPDVKCCSYVPTLPNFLVGQARADDDPGAASGQAAIAHRIAGGVGVTPLGVARGAAYDLLYRRSSVAAFGRSLGLRCPFYQDEGGGLCGIWRHRNAICATWFCKHVRGAIGERFWEALRDLLEAVEVDLAYWCVAELGVNVPALRQLFPRTPLRGARLLEAADLDEVADPATYRAAWGDWLGREHEFYRECGRLTGQLRWSDVVGRCGARVALLGRLVQAAYVDLLGDDLPSTLRVGVFTLADLGTDRCRLMTSGDHESLDAPRALLAALPYFDGRPWPDAVAAAVEHEGIKLDRSLVRRLVDFEILVPGDADADAVAAPEAGCGCQTDGARCHGGGIGAAQLYTITSQPTNGGRT